jgi:hypothetical protein
MDMFDVKRFDRFTLDRYTDVKKPPFGGPNEKEEFVGNKRKSLNKYQRVIERNRKTEGDLHDPTTGKEMFQHNYDSAWHAVTSDKISRDAKKKPTDIMTAKPTIFTQQVEEGKIMRFEQFVNEGFDNPEGFEEQQDFMQTEGEEEVPNIENEDPVDLGYEVDEEQLEKLMEEYGDDLNELIDKITEEMEIEKEAVSDLLCAAIEKICKPEDEDENGGEELPEEPETPEEPGA